MLLNAVWQICVDSMNLPNLKELLMYKNENVIKRFCIRYPNRSCEADLIFQDMLQFLWLGQKLRNDKMRDSENPAFSFTAVMHEEMRIIDEMWHDFILMTQDYHDFCINYFGNFIHHQVNMRDELQNDIELNTDNFLEETERYFSYIYDNLGEKVLYRWFKEHFAEDISYSHT